MMISTHTYSARRLAAVAVLAAMTAAGCSTVQRKAEVTPVDQHFMLFAAATGTAEVKMGQLAAEKSTDPRVREFGQRMVTDHQRVNAQLMQIAQAKKVTLPMAMDPANRTLYEELSALSGPEFDRQYLASQVNIHAMGNALYANEAENGLDPDVTRFARDNTSVGVQHFSIARSMVR